MKILTQKRCIIGEGPIWNEREKALYFTNGGGEEICRYLPETNKLACIGVKNDCAAIVFDKNNNIIVSGTNGVFMIKRNGNIKGIYDGERNRIKYANDMKVGPDGRIYVGTQSERRVGISKKINGKLYSIDRYGTVRLLLDDMLLSNGMEWSVDEKYFYHTDSDTNIIKEYEFDKERGDISFTGRQVRVLGIDGFTIGYDNMLYAACWGHGCIAIINTKYMTIEKKMAVPCNNPSSCCFCGDNYDTLAVTTASLGENIEKDKNAGYTILMKANTKGRKPYLFG